MDDYKSENSNLENDPLHWEKKEAIERWKKDDFIPLEDCDDFRSVLTQFIESEDFMGFFENIFARINITPYPDPYDLLIINGLLEKLEYVFCNEDNSYIKLTALKIITYLTSGYQDENSPFLNEERITNYLDLLTPSNTEYIHVITDLFFNCFADNNIGVQFCEICYGKGFLQRICNLVLVDSNSSLVKLYIKMAKRFVEEAIDPVLDLLYSHEEDKNEEQSDKINLEPFYFLAKTLHVMFPKDQKSNIRVCKILHFLLHLPKAPLIIQETALFEKIVQYLLTGTVEEESYMIVFNSYNQLMEKFPPEYALDSIPKVIEKVEKMRSLNDSQIIPITNFMGQAYEHQMAPIICNSRLFECLINEFENFQIDSKKTIIDILSLYFTEISFHDSFEPYPWLKDAVMLLFRELESVSGTKLEIVLKRLIYCLSTTEQKNIAEVALAEDIESTIENIMDMYDGSIVDTANELLSLIHEISEHVSS